MFCGDLAEKWERVTKCAFGGDACRMEAWAFHDREDDDVWIGSIRDHRFSSRRIEKPQLTIFSWMTPNLVIAYTNFRQNRTHALAFLSQRPQCVHDGIQIFVAAAREVDENDALFGHGGSQLQYVANGMGAF